MLEAYPKRPLRSPLQLAPESFAYCKGRDVVDASAPPVVSLDLKSQDPWRPGRRVGPGVRRHKAMGFSGCPLRLGPVLTQQI